MFHLQICNKVALAYLSNSLHLPEASYPYDVSNLETLIFFPVKLGLQRITLSKWKKDPWPLFVFPAFGELFSGSSLFPDTLPFPSGFFTLGCGSELPNIVPESKTNGLWLFRLSFPEVSA